MPNRLAIELCEMCLKPNTSIWPRRGRNVKKLEAIKLTSKTTQVGKLRKHAREKGAEFKQGRGTRDAQARTQRSDTENGARNTLTCKLNLSLLIQELEGCKTKIILFI
ncbi:unnamed protein product [Cylicocyclus nassatus]|uniref:Uncharacterized protein n=1 Tax=Cylicocyclus nassatus TaxID=53992 RepID=A0AA36DKG2_CYLNA|nr:unnamed protein product [Cylicocyclus nassatus]